MTHVDLKGLTARGARELLECGDVSSVELTQAFLERIDEIEPSVRAFVTVTPELALEQARLADERIASGSATALTGIPMQLKDNMATKGVATTCSSRILEGFIPPYDATVATKLYDEGAVLTGKGNLDEFAMGSSTENSAFFPTRNPWGLDRVPGGSSGGPAAAVAAGQCVYSLGSDTGGSIRQPASLCGVVGLKPTYGLVSRYGLVAFASSLDQIGPITRDVGDAALVLNAVAGHDSRDSTSINREVPDYTKALTGDIKGLRVGVPKEYFVEGMEPGVEDAIRKAIDTLDDLGAVVSETSLPSTPYAMAVYYIVAPSEASANLARYDGVKYGYSTDTPGNMWDSLEDTRREGFGPEVKRRIMIGTYALSAGYYDAWYKKALQVRTLIRAGVPAGLSGVRRSGVAHLTVGRLPSRRKDDGPVHDVSQRRFHPAGKYRGHPRDLDPGGVERRPTRGAPVHGIPSAGRGAPPRRPRLRTGNGLAQGASETVTPVCRGKCACSVLWKLFTFLERRVVTSIPPELTPNALLY